MGRSYGDTALSDGGTILLTQAMDRIIAADWDTGVIRAEAGLTLDVLLKIAVPRGWFLAVTPGSKFVTLGGCIANDVHGKNHHIQGSFGTCLRAFELRRSDRDKPVVCTSSQNKTLFRATLGGLGLTGIIGWAEIQLKPIKSAYLDSENIPYPDLDTFLKLSDESADWDYTVAWIDCFARGDNRGRGIFTRARFTDSGALKPHSDPRLRMIVTVPSFFLNKLSIRAFNWLYRWRPGAKFSGKVHYGPFFYPLDGIAEWNRLYGRRGFFQHQCLIPPDQARAGMLALLEAIEQSGQGSFLAVLKKHGAEPSPGLMSFCAPGLSLALDFANRGKKTKALLTELDQIVLEHGGRLYPAKDGRMSADTFKTAFPDWQKLEKLRDPALLSAFWSRILREDDLGMAENTATSETDT
jgi:L-gulonolactone oxidase